MPRRKHKKSLKNNTNKKPTEKARVEVGTKVECLVHIYMPREDYHVGSILYVINNRFTNANGNILIEVSTKERLDNPSLCCGSDSMTQGKFKKSYKILK